MYCYLLIIPINDHSLLNHVTKNGKTVSGFLTFFAGSSIMFFRGCLVKRPQHYGYVVPSLFL
jgi:dolichol kinase